MKWTKIKSIPDQLRPRSTTTAIVIAEDWQGSGGNYATASQPRRWRWRVGHQARGRRSKRELKMVDMRVGMLNVGTMTGKSKDIVDMMERRQLEVLCIQETKWKGSKARVQVVGWDEK